MNTIHVIRPFKYEGQWVFSDERTGLDKEPFVAGADTILDVLTAHLPNAGQGVTLRFSARPFPGHQDEFAWRREENGGHWYWWPSYGMEGWLCPALFKYFEKAPKKLYIELLDKNAPASL